MNAKTSIVRLYGEFAVIAGCSAVVGAGSGFLQGIAGSLYSSEPYYRSVFAESAAFVGCYIAAILGPVLYFIVLEKRLSLLGFCYIVTITTASAVTAAWLMALAFGDGWLSWLVAVAAAIVIARRVRSADSAGKESR